MITQSDRWYFLGATICMILYTGWICAYYHDVIGGLSTGIGFLLVLCLFFYFQNSHSIKSNRR